MTTRTPTTDQVRATYYLHTDNRDWEASLAAQFDRWLTAHTQTIQINAFRDCIEWLSNEELHGQDARTAARLAAELDEFLAEKYGEPTAEQLSAANAAREVTA